MGAGIFFSHTERKNKTPKKRKTPATFKKVTGVSLKELVGDDLLSHNVSVAVPSALEGLTSEFEMGSGGPPPLKPPTKLFAYPSFSDSSEYSIRARYMVSNKMIKS